MRIRFAVLPLLLLSGCVSVPPATIATPEALKPIQGPQEAPKVIYVSDITAKLIDKKIGQMKAGTLCVGGADLIWTDNQSALTAIQHQIEQTLKNNGYNVYSGLVRSKAEKDADILIGVAINDIKANICYSVDGMKGSASLRLDWEVVDNKSNQSQTFSTSGASTISEFSATGDPDVFVKAAEMATDNLLADKRFFESAKK